MPLSRRTFSAFFALAVRSTSSIFRKKIRRGELRTAEATVTPA